MKKKLVSLLLTLTIVLTLVPTAVFAVENDGQVHVIVENTTFTPDTANDLGAKWKDTYWYGTLVDAWVPINQSSSMMSSVVTALEAENYTQSGAESNYIETINGLSAFDGGSQSGWMGTLNDWFTNEGFGAFTVASGKLEAGDEIRIMYTSKGYGADLGGSWGNSDTTIKSLEFSSGKLSPAFEKDTHTYTLTIPAAVNGVVVTPTASNKNYQVRTSVNGNVYKRTANVPVENGTEILVECNYKGSLSMNSSGDTQSYSIKVEKESASEKGPQDVSAVLNAAMTQLAVTVPSPKCGSTGGEWVVLGLARGELFNKDNAYFTDYYNGIVDYVNTQAASVAKGGALHNYKSTENSRVIVALSAIGKSAEKMGDWNLLTPYEDFSWIERQGINGPTWALIALDSHNYQTQNSTIRQQCIDYILNSQTSDGGWSMSGASASADPDMTGMVLQALAPYASDSTVKEAIDKGVKTLSGIQQNDGGFASWGTSNSESIAQVIVACASLGINPDTDSRFIKNGNSAVDALLSFYNKETNKFNHTATAKDNLMATEQCVYALVAYNRLVNNKTSLYDMSDVDFSSQVTELTATLGIPQEISNKKGTSFKAIVNIDGWNNEDGYKLMDAVVSVPNGFTVKNITMGSRVSGGQINYNLEESTGKLRIVYFDPENNENLTIDGSEFPAEFFVIEFESTKEINAEKLDIAVTGMSMKFNSDSESEASMKVVNISKANGSIALKKELSYSAVILYRGDGIDLIPEDKMAVCVAVANLDTQASLTFSNSSDTYAFLYSDEITKKTGVMSYVALVDASIALNKFVDSANFTIDEANKGAEIKFGDTNGDNVINAQDALNSVNYWLRKSYPPTDSEILRTNVNSDSRINTFDALGIVEYFVKGSDYIIVNKAAMAASSVN